MSNTERKQSCELSNKLGKCSQEYMAAEANKLLNKAVSSMINHPKAQELIILSMVLTYAYVKFT